MVERDPCDAWTPVYPIQQGDLSPGPTKLVRVHTYKHTCVNRFLKPHPLCLLQCRLMASHKNTTKHQSFCRVTQSRQKPNLGGPRRVLEGDMACPFSSQ